MTNHKTYYYGTCNFDMLPTLALGGFEGWGKRKMKDKDNIAAVAALVFICVAVVLIVILIITKGWLLAAIPLAILMIPWIGEAFKDGADF